MQMVLKNRNNNRNNNKNNNKNNNYNPSMYKELIDTTSRIKYVS